MIPLICCCSTPVFPNAKSTIDSLPNNILSFPRQLPEFGLILSEQSNYQILPDFPDKCLIPINGRSIEYVNWWSMWSRDNLVCSLSILLQTSIMLSNSFGSTFCCCNVCRTFVFWATASACETSRTWTITSCNAAQHSPATQTHEHFVATHVHQVTTFIHWFTDSSELFPLSDVVMNDESFQQRQQRLPKSQQICK